MDRGDGRSERLCKRPGQSEQVCATFDLTRSFLTLAGATTDSLDGQDIVGQVMRGEPPKDRTLFWRGRRGDRTWSAVRSGDVKLVQRREGEASESWLFDLEKDVSEKHDLTATRPDDARRMAELLRQWEADVDRNRLK